MKRVIQILVTVLALTCATSWSQTAVVYPGPRSEGNFSQNDIVELLGAALKATERQYGPATLASSPLPMNQERAMVELKANDLVNVAWGSTSVDLEEQFIPIRIPLRKGLNGFHIALINGSKQTALDKIQSLDDLKTRPTGAAFGWIDGNILRANHLQVVQANYDALFAMTVHDRLDLFLLGMNEAFAEYDVRKKSYPALAVEQSLVIYYPKPCYFFVNKQNPVLAERIRTGLEKLIASGSFDRIFAKYNKPILRRANLAQRRILVLDNPYLPKDTPVDARYWIVPGLTATAAKGSTDIMGKLMSVLH